MNKANAVAQPESVPVEHVIPVFWTGGWDSSFRVIDLAVRFGCLVQPIYVIDNYRKSWRQELAAIERIKAEMEVRFPTAAKSVLELIVIPRESIQIPKHIKEQYGVLRSLFGVSWQYEWLAAVVEQSEFSSVEVSFQGSDQGRLFEFIRKHSDSKTYACGATTNVLVDWEPRDDFEVGAKLFHYFTYPTLNIPKTEMETIAAEGGFDDLLTLTWFCHYPWGQQPCGACSVCRHYLDAGLSKPFSRSAVIRSKFWFIVHPMRLVLSNPERFVERVRDNAMWVKAKLFHK